ncbi:MAG: tripartite tricarboxylate transporter permease [Lautropia sp.]
MLDAIVLALQPLSIVASVVGVILGIIFGAIPGLSATLGLALLLPATFFMPSDQGLIMLGGVYVGAIYGGSISAVLLNIPGTAASIVTAEEGHALARKGEAPLALGLSAVSSGVGGLLSAFALLFLTPVLATLALKFGPAEYVALVVFSLVIVTMVLPTPVLGNATGAFIGLALASIGLDPVTGADRYTYGFYPLMGGLPLIPMLIGFFAMPQVLSLAVDAISASKPAEVGSAEGHRGSLITHMLRHWATVIRSSLVGIGMGILPAIGPVATPVVMHSLERKLASEKDKAAFGQGSIIGLIAAETSNNANVGGSLIPLMSLGIPGSGAAAVFLGGLTIHGLQPGPLLFTENGPVIYTFFMGFIIVNLLMMLIGLYGARHFAVVLKVPKSLIATFVVVFSIFGAYASGSAMFYVWVVLAATVLALGLRAIRVPILAVVLGLILGNLLEQQIVQMATSFPGPAYLLQRPIALGFFALTLAVVLVIGWQRASQKPVEPRT